jgi:hypothetical protein
MNQNQGTEEEEEKQIDPLPAVQAIHLSKEKKTLRGEERGEKET